MEKYLKEFDEKFVSPKSMWVKTDNNKWVGKSVIKDFLLSSLQSYGKEEYERGKNERYELSYQAGKEDGYNEGLKEVKGDMRRKFYQMGYADGAKEALNPEI